jgi:hypothetical protein
MLTTQFYNQSMNLKKCVSCYTEHSHTCCQLLYNTACDPKIFIPVLFRTYPHPTGAHLTPHLTQRMQNYWVPGCVGGYIWYCLQSLVWHLLQITPLAPIISRWLLDFWKISLILPYNQYICTAASVVLSVLRVYGFHSTCTEVRCVCIYI